MNGGYSQFARVLESLQPKPTEAMHWLQNAGRVIAANSERWAEEDAENARIDAAEYPDCCGLCGGSFSDDDHAMLSGDCPTEYERKS